MLGDRSVQLKFNEVRVFTDYYHEPVEQRLARASSCSIQALLNASAIGWVAASQVACEPIGHCRMPKISLRFVSVEPTNGATIVGP